CSGPDGCVTTSSFRCCVDTGSQPGIGGGIVFPASIRKTKEALLATPDDHFTRRPNCSMSVSCRRRVDGTRRQPAIRDRIVSPTLIQHFKVSVVAAPNDHLIVCPYCCVVLTGLRCVDADLSPNVRDGIVPTA